MKTSSEHLEVLKKSVSDLNALLNGEGKKKSFNKKLIWELIITIGDSYNFHLNQLTIEKRKRTQPEDIKIRSLYRAMADDASVRSDGSVYLSEGMVLWPDGSITPE